VEAYVRYRRTARFDELLCIETRLTELARVKIRFDYRLLREPEGNVVIPPEDQIVAEGHTLLACVDQHHIPRRIPAEAEKVLLGPDLELHPQIGGERGLRPSANGQGHASNGQGHASNGHGHASNGQGHAGVDADEVEAPSERVAALGTKA
jgi:hypothetical protein